MKIDSKETLFLIDGSSFLYRAYYGLRPLYTKSGVPVQAVYGFCRMIKKLIDQFDPKQMVLVWDSKGKTVRHELFKEYKATRQAPPSDLFVQKDYIVKFADLIELQQCAQVGVEADDLLYTLAKNAEKKGQKSVIITSDKDMGQALSDHVVLYDFFQETITDTKVFETKMGFAVQKSVFYFSLLGDSSDNIPGVNGIGKKGALDLVTQFESLEDLYNHLDQVKKPSMRAVLEKQKDEAFLSKSLFMLRICTIKESDHNFDANKWNQARPLFEELEFKSMLLSSSKIETDNESSAVKVFNKHPWKVICVNTEELLENLISEIHKNKTFAYDTETDSLNALQSNLVGISICVEEGEAYYIPCGHRLFNENMVQEHQLTKEYVLKIMRPLFEDESFKKIAHHGKFDALVLFNQGIKVKGLYFDTLIAASLVKDEWQKGSLKSLSEHYLNEPMRAFEDVVDGKQYKTFADVPIEHAIDYAAADAHQTFALYRLFEKLLKEQGLEKIFYDIEMPIANLLFEIESRGIYCDVDDLKRLDLIVSKELEAIKQTIFALIGENFSNINLNSSQQVGKLLFEDLKLPPQKQSAKKTAQSTDVEVLEILAKIHPVPAYIIQYRELFKLKSTYIDGLSEHINPKTKRIHTTYSQTRVVTGRLSSSEPNLQNIPADGIGLMIRSAFKPQCLGRVFLSADYSQIELRVLAHFSGDTHLINAFKQEHDIHSETASKIFDVDLIQVTKQMRAVGKRINFSILYGLTAYGLAKDLNISNKDAKKYIDTYFEQYKSVRIWMDSVIEQTKKNGYVQTMLGRKRAISGIHERNKHLYDLACRIAINTVAQGTAAEIMKMGMLAVDKAIKNENCNAHIVLQIHDELVLSVEEKEIEKVKEIVRIHLEQIVSWQVPLMVNISVGVNWKEIT